jgi:hypothetical protein
MISLVGEMFGTLILARSKCKPVKRAVSIPSNTTRF